MVDLKKVSEKEFQFENLPKQAQKPDKKDFAEKSFESLPKENALENDRENILADTEGRVSAETPGALNASGGVLAQRQKEIEKVLEKDLEEIYLSMDEQKKEEFKIMGEETAREINVLLEKAKVKVTKIIALIKKWLSIIPGVNKFFIEQEAKIKADEIIKLKQV